jgi:hypothetical protein
MTAPSSVLVMTPDGQLDISYPICAPWKFILSGKRTRRIWSEGSEGANGEREGWMGWWEEAERAGGEEQ